MMVSFTRTPAHATRMPSGGSDFEVDPLYFAARISLETYEHVGEAFSTRSAFNTTESKTKISDNAPRFFVDAKIFEDDKPRFLKHRQTRS